MDYDKLYQILPNDPKQWSQKDVGIWLDFIGLYNLYPLFNQSGVDGSCLEILLDSDLIEIGITQVVHKKKILNWIQIGLVEYKRYLNYKLKSSQLSPTNQKLQQQMQPQQQTYPQSQTQTQQKNLEQSNGNYNSLLVDESVYQSGVGVCRINSIQVQEFKPSHRQNPRINFQRQEPPNQNLGSLISGEYQSIPYGIPLDQSFCDQQPNQDEYQYKIKENENRSRSPTPEKNNRTSDKRIFDNVTTKFTQSMVNNQLDNDVPYFGTIDNQNNDNNKENLINGRPDSLINSINISLIYDENGRASNETFKVQQENCSFGRNLDCQIKVQSEQASRIHAWIIYKDGQYFIQDRASLTGTFVFLQGRTLVQKGIIVQMGSNDFTIQDIQVDKNECTVTLMSQVGSFNFVLILNKTCMVFGKQSVPNLTHDQLLSSEHTNWSYTEEGLVIEDVTSSNGTWLRLSKPGVQSLNFPITYERIIKIANHIYQITPQQ